MMKYDGVWNWSHPIVAIEKRTLSCPACGGVLSGQHTISPFTIDKGDYDKLKRDRRLSRMALYNHPQTRMMTCGECGVVVVVPIVTLRNIELYGRQPVREGL
jgi:ribosomal protein S27E